MPDVVKHAWTHRPRAQGGTDPLPVVEAAGGIVSHFPRHPVHVGNESDGFTMWPGGVVVISAAKYKATGTSSADASNNYSGQSFLRFTTAATTYAGAANLVVVNPAAIELMDDHAYQIIFQFRLGSSVSNAKVAWMHAGVSPAEVLYNCGTSPPVNDWFSIGNMVDTVGLAKVQHGTNIEIRAYAPSAVQIDIDQIIFVPYDYQADSPTVNADPHVFDTYNRVPDTGKLSASANIEFPDLTHFNGQCVSDTQTVHSVLDPAFRWTTTDWASGFQPSPQGVDETNGFAWEAGHGRHLYVSARLQGEAGEEETAFFAAGMVSYGSNGMPHSSANLWNNSWQLVYLGPVSPSHEHGHLAGWVVAADGGGDNETPFDDDGETTVADVRIATMMEVTCLYDPQGC